MNSKQHFLQVVRARLHDLKKTADRALVQIDEKSLHRILAKDTNSIALIMQHVSNNMRSRWTDFLTSDGEKPNRNRDAEFVDQRRSLNELKGDWDEAWQLVDDVIAGLDEEDLMKIVYIRQEAHTVMEAILRQLAHYAYHVGQIVYLSKHFAGDAWRTLTIPLPDEGATESTEATIERLERSHLKPDVRSSIEAVMNLLDEYYVEFGSSGRVFRRADYADSPLPEDEMEMEDFRCVLLAPDVAHTTYRVVNLTRGTVTNRSSIWRQENGAWKLYFHQGTKTG